MNTKPPRAPTLAQVERAMALACTRQVVEGEAVTRAERCAAVNRVLLTATYVEADALIRLLRTRPVQRAWEERTPRFGDRHRSLVARLQGRPDPAEAEAWFHRFVGKRGWLSTEVAREPVTPGPEAVAEAKALIKGGGRVARDSASELKAWYKGREVKEDEVWGEMLVGPWD